MKLAEVELTENHYIDKMPYDLKDMIKKKIIKVENEI